MGMELTISFPGGSKVDAACESAIIKTDQPISDGGEGSAPTPFTLFLASMGTCAGIYVLSFCQQRGLPTEDIRIRERVNFDGKTHLADEVTLDIELPSDFPEKYRHALVKAAQLCAVKRHLENPPSFNIVTSKRP
jgi:ribosomal protein S12 methylthiotransferase accessory factor